MKQESYGVTMAVLAQHGRNYQTKNSAKLPG
jgi:hypothetical protein